MIGYGHGFLSMVFPNPPRHTSCSRRTLRSFGVHYCGWPLHAFIALIRNPTCRGWIAYEQTLSCEPITLLGSCFSDSWSNTTRTCLDNRKSQSLRPQWSAEEGASYDCLRCRQNEEHLRRNRSRSGYSRRTVLALEVHASLVLPEIVKLQVGHACGKGCDLFPIAPLLGCLFCDATLENPGDARRSI